MIWAGHFARTEEREGRTQVFGKERDHLEGLSVDGRIIFK